MVPLAIADSDGTATVGGDEDPIDSSGPDSDPILFDLLITKIPDYIILPLDSTFSVTLHADSRNNRDAEMVIVWTVFDENDISITNGSFSYLFYDYENIDFDIEVTAPKEEGNYILSIKIFNDDTLSGTTSSPFHAYSAIGFIFGPGWGLLVLVVVAVTVVFLLRFFG